jgi:hypothetical protein
MKMKFGVCLLHQPTKNYFGQSTTMEKKFELFFLNHQFKATLWKMPYGNDDNNTLVSQVELSGFTDPLHKVLWHPSLYQYNTKNVYDQVITVDSKCVKEWNFDAKKHLSGV